MGMHAEDQPSGQNESLGEMCLEVAIKFHIVHGVVRNYLCYNQSEKCEGLQFKFLS